MLGQSRGSRGGRGRIRGILLLAICKLNVQQLTIALLWSRDFLHQTASHNTKSIQKLEDIT
jgi:hypothetical protein